MALTPTQLRANLRTAYLDKIIELLTAQGEEVLRTASNEIALPCVDEAGEDQFVVITVKVPTGSRDGDAYDGYGVAEDYVRNCSEKEAKAKVAAEKKAKKIAADQARREQLAKAKAEREATKNG